ncbi:MAG TPA: FMN-binding protein [Oscillospiraceae bacterium]|nr:FMN-binding protein [Oscillospiraceae bacterium]HNY00373.1 FMN-binding protein [Oscillospiraceae bacterium]HPS76020.1 FMN-binding protein [Oscillospiraceae bacterium]
MDALEKKKNSPNIAKLALVLFAVTAITALVLGLVNGVTKDRIAALAVEKTKTAYANVLKADSYAKIDDAYTNDGTITKLSAAKDASGTAVGYVAETTFSGAQGMVTMVVGLNADKACTGIYVTKSSETSGLGAKASETSPGAWRDNLVGATDGVALAKDGGTVEAISGATITSRACTKEVQTVITAVSSLG